MLRLVIWPSMMLLGRTETELWTLKYGSKSIQTSLILRQRPPKSYKLLKFFMISVILFKMGKHSNFHLSYFQIVDAWRDFTVVTKLIRNYKSLYGFWGRCLKVGDVCMDFEPYFKVLYLVSVHHGQHGWRYGSQARAPNEKRPRHSATWRPYTRVRAYEEHTSD